MAEYEIGYGRPPRANQFVKGQSGNPNGRPKGRKNVATIFHEVTRELIRVTENGKGRDVTKLEAILRQLTAKAVAGDFKAMSEVLKLDRTFEFMAEEGNSDSPDIEKDQAVMRRLLERMQRSQTPETENA